MLGFMSCRGLPTGVPPRKTDIKNCSGELPLGGLLSWDKISASCSQPESHEGEGGSIIWNNLIVPTCHLGTKYFKLKTLLRSWRSVTHVSDIKSQSLSSVFLSEKWKWNKINMSSAVRVSSNDQIWRAFGTSFTLSARKDIKTVIQNQDWKKKQFKDFCWRI